MDIYNIVSLAGLGVLVLIGWVLSADRRRVCWRTVGAGVGLQLLVGLMVFRSPRSRDVFVAFNDLVLKFLDAATEGQRFVFGPLAESSSGFILATQVLPVIIFFSALMGLLYYAGVMQRIVRGFAWVFTRLMRVSGAESLCTASNIFVGIESATTVRPHLAAMTRSEFCTILTAGMATVASSTMALYVILLHKVFPTIAGHLLSASLLSAPAALVMSKLLLPERERPATLGEEVRVAYERESSAVEAVIAGAMAGVRLVVGIVALLIAFLGLVAVADLVYKGVTTLSIAETLGLVFSPMAVLMGVPPADAALAGKLLGVRLLATEVPAYQQLADAMASGTFSHPRSAVIVAYALCGFAHVASLAIFAGGIAALVPERRRDIAAAGPRALLAATLACLMTGAVAGTFFHTASVALAP